MTVNYNNLSGKRKSSTI